ncbi:MAG: helix-turn-helix domain-containing protein [Halothiobacillus sp.]
MEKTARRQYQHLSAEEPATIMWMHRAGCGLREVGRFMNRSPGTISREPGRNPGSASGHEDSLAGAQARRWRFKPRRAEHSPYAHRK